MVYTLKSGDSAVRAYNSIFSYSSGYSAGRLQFHQCSTSNSNDNSNGLPIDASFETDFTCTVARSVRSVDEDRSSVYLETFLPSLSSPVSSGSSTANGNLLRIASVTQGIAKPAVFETSYSGSFSFSAFSGGFSAAGAKDDAPYIEINYCDSSDDPTDATTATDSLQSMSYRLDVSSLHGDIVADSWFGGCSFSPDERFVAYVANLKRDKKTTFFSSSNSNSNSVGDIKEEVHSSKYEYVDDWGERFTNVEELGIFILDVQKQQVVQLPDVNAADWTIGQPQFLTLPKNTATDVATATATAVDVQYVLCYTAWSCHPRKLGIVYCYQRPSKLFAVDVTQLLSSTTTTTTATITTTIITTAAADVVAGSSSESTKVKCVHKLLTTTVHSARSPRCTSDGAKLAFLGSKRGFATHNGCADLMVIDMQHVLALLKQSTDEVTTAAAITATAAVAAATTTSTTAATVTKMDAADAAVVVVAAVAAATAAAAADGEDVTSLRAIDAAIGGSFAFPGIYCDQLPTRCFLESTTTGSRNSSEHWVVFTSMWGSSNVMLKASLESGDVQLLLPFENNSNSTTATATTPNTFTSATTTTTAAATAVSECNSRGSYSVLDVHRNCILFVYSTPTKPPLLAVNHLQSGALFRIRRPVQQAVSRKMNYTPLSSSISSASSGSSSSTSSSSDAVAALGLSDLDWKIFHHRSNNNSNNNSSNNNSESIGFESILLYPRGKSNLPLILVPHGGPHSATATSFIASYAFLCAYLQVAVLHVNYRGSIGFGQRNIDSLPGFIGTNDVADMMQALKHATTLSQDSINSATGSLQQQQQQQKKLINADKVAVVGGSHGGFLTGHLIGQFPDVFKAAAMRNPVTNIPSMVSVSDIPDWCFVEALGSSSDSSDSSDSYDFSTVPIASAEQLQRMLRCSPIEFVASVRCPTLLCLGAKDRRVPPSQGVEFYHILKARGVHTRLLMFPEDNHAIDKPASEAEHWVSIADWFERHLL